MLSAEVMMAQVPAQDPSVLREQAYADDTCLEVRRRTHRLYTVDPVDFGRWTLERLSWRGDERVLDVGCGPGELLCRMAEWQDGWGLLVGFDFSPGMVRQAVQRATGARVQFFAADAQHIPLPDGSFDVVMARHMLYHVPDIERAVAEAARLLRSDGRILVTANSLHSMAEFWAMCAQAAEQCAAVAPAAQLGQRFAVENAAPYLEPYFDRLQTYVLPGVLRFSTAGPFVDYFASCRALVMQPGHTDAEWQAVLDFVRGEAESIVARRGRLDITKSAGAIVGVKRG